MLTLIKRPRTSLRNGKKPRQWKFGHLKLVLHCNTCCANTTKYALASSTLKTRNGLGKSEPRPAARRIATSRSSRTASPVKIEPLCIVPASPASFCRPYFMQQNQRVKNVWFDCFSSMPSYSLISIGRRQRGQGSPLAWDYDILPSLPSVAQIATMKIRTPARCERSPTKQFGNRDKKSRIRVARNRRLACSR